MIPSYFNPRSPCGERPCGGWRETYRIRFQSTLPVWGATYAQSSFFPALSISIHAPRVGSDKDQAVTKVTFLNFNPRSPCGERPERGILWQRKTPFQSTLPVWGATETTMRRSLQFPFQSTLPVWGATGGGMEHSTVMADFNPRSPCGERHSLHRLRLQTRYFNPRSPCGERRFGNVRCAVDGNISIHAPRVGSDQGVLDTGPHLADFNPRSPCGERPSAEPKVEGSKHFNPRSPCGERLPVGPYESVGNEFQSTLPVWGATNC